MTINPTIFREYDIRGVAGNDLDEETMETIGRAYCTYIRNKRAHNTILVGRDGRLTGKAYANAIIDGVTSCGVNVIDIGQVPSPVLYHALNTLKVDGGLMLTASHNPKEYNGVKVGVGKTTIFGPEIQKLLKIIQDERFPKRTTKPVTITRMDVVPAYIKRIVKGIHLKRKLKVVVDAANGVGGVVAVPLFEQLGCEVIPLFCDVDGNFPNHHADPTKAENLKDLIKAVKKHKADVGIGFDGDVDRLGGCDEEGNILWGDRLLALFAEHVLKDKPGSTIIGEVKCSRSLYSHIEKCGGKPLMWRTGHSHLKAAMKSHKAQLAGEMSGHIFFQHRWYGFDDAIYSAARLLEIVASGRKPLSAHFKKIPVRPVTPELEFACPDEKKFDVIARLTHYFQEELGFDVITIDGARIEFPDGWGLIRASNTSPKLVMRVEGDTEKRKNEIKKLIEDKVAEFNV